MGAGLHSAMRRSSEAGLDHVAPGAGRLDRRVLSSVASEAPLIPRSTMSAVPRLRRLAWSLLAIVLLPLPAQAQWVADGVSVCGATGVQRSPDLVPDGSGGAVVFWV